MVWASLSISCLQKELWGVLHNSECLIAPWCPTPVRGQYFHSADCAITGTLYRQVQSTGGNNLFSTGNSYQRTASRHHGRDSSTQARVKTKHKRRREAPRLYLPYLHPVSLASTSISYLSIIQTASRPDSANHASSFPHLLRYYDLPPA